MNDDLRIHGVREKEKLGNLKGDYFFLLSIALGVIILDQITKHLVRINLGFGEMWTPSIWLAPYARIVHWKNTGAAFGMFQNAGEVFTILAVVVAFAIIIYFPEIPKSERYLRLALSLQMGGAIGNMIDRLTQGWVTDFVSVSTFPVFNVADASISIGLVLILFPLLGELPHEYNRWTLSRRIQEIINRYQSAGAAIHHNRFQDEEVLSLGVLEILLRDNKKIEPFLLKLRAKRIRQKYKHQHKGRKHSG